MGGTHAEHTLTPAFCNVDQLRAETVCEIGRFAIGLHLYTDCILYEHKLETKGIMSSFCMIGNIDDVRFGSVCCLGIDNTRVGMQHLGH